MLTEMSFSVIKHFILYGGLICFSSAWEFCLFLVS